jgi:glycosyltransferase involved in cell wall biosynthesis
LICARPPAGGENVLVTDEALCYLTQATGSRCQDLRHKRHRLLSMNESRTAASPRRVLYIHNNADLYGASRMLLRWLKHLDRRQLEVLVMLPENGPLKELIEAEGVEVILHRRLSIITRPVFHSWRIILFGLNFPVSVISLWRLMRRRGIDAVYTNTGVIVSPALAAWLAGVPHIWHIREWFQEFRKWWPAYAWYIRTFSRRIITVSNAIAGQFAPPGTALVVHDGFSLDEFQVPKSKLREEYRSRFGLGDALVVGCVGRIKLVRKGQEFLVQAVSVLKQRGLRIKALIVGAPFPGNEEHLAYLHRLARELGVEGDVVFAGEVRDARPAYAAMDMVALTSAQPEPFGGVVMEAMAMGLPAIATNIGGSLDQVVEGVTGLLVPPADPVALAEAIEKLMKDPALRERMGRAGPERIRNHFTLSEMTGKIERVILDSIARRSPDSPPAGILPGGEPPGAAAPRRVLHVHNNADIYGSGRSLLRLIKSLDRRRFEPLVVLPEAGPLKQMIEAQGVGVVLHPGLSVITRSAFRSWRLLPLILRYPLSVLFLRRLIRRRRIELVHTNTGVIFSPAPAAWLAGVPHVWHVREWFQEFWALWPLYSRYIQCLSSRVVAVSGAIAGQFSRRDNVALVHNGFDLEEFQVPKAMLRIEVRRRYALDDKFVVGCVGRIKLVRKGQEVIVQAAALLKQRGRHVKVLIVGAPSPGNEEHLVRLRQMVVALGVEDTVLFVGELADPRPAYAAMDVAAMTSAQPEPFAGVVMEAMSMGLPVIASRVGGSLDQVLDGVTGIFVPPGDPMALANAMERLMDDPELRTRMGVAAVDRIRNDFSLVEMTKNIERLFDEAISGRKG